LGLLNRVGQVECGCIDNAGRRLYHEILVRFKKSAGWRVSGNSQ